MNIKEVKDLIHDILQSDISEFELEHTGTRVKLRRGFAHGEGVAASDVQVNVRPLPLGREPGVSLPIGIASSAVPRGESPVEEGLHIITSPIVGTFFLSPSPTAEPYVKIGSKIELGAMLCIVEAMKLMNEIPSDVAGEVVEIYVVNGQPVEFGQKLFAIRPHK